MYMLLKLQHTIAKSVIVWRERATTAASTALLLKHAVSQIKKVIGCALSADESYIRHVVMYVILLWPTCDFAHLCGDPESEECVLNNECYYTGLITGSDPSSVLFGSVRRTVDAPNNPIGNRHPGSSTKLCTDPCHKRNEGGACVAPST
eukprot:2583613-Pyramimonas_sp.AAC.4